MNHESSTNGIRPQKRMEVQTSNSSKRFLKLSLQLLYQVGSFPIDCTCFCSAAKFLKLLTVRPRCTEFDRFEQTVRRCERTTKWTLERTAAKMCKIPNNQPISSVLSCAPKNFICSLRKKNKKPENDFSDEKLF